MPKRSSKQYTIANQKFRNFVKDVCKALYAENIPYVIVGGVAVQLHQKQNNLQNYRPTNDVDIVVKADPAKVKEVIAKYKLGKIEEGQSLGRKTIYAEQPRFYASIYCQDELPPAEEIEINSIKANVEEFTSLLANKIYLYKTSSKEKNLKDMVSLLQIYVKKLKELPKEEKKMLYRKVGKELEKRGIDFVIDLFELIEILKQVS